MPLKRKDEASISFQEVIQGIRRIFDEEKVDVDEVSDLLSAYHSDPRDWLKYVNFDPHRYTRNLVDEGNGKYNLMILCWGEGMGSSVHDHSDAHCFVKILEGSLTETQFHWPQDPQSDLPLVEKGQTTVSTNHVCYINDSIGLHRMDNPSHSDQAISLHLYIPPFQECQTFDERTGHKRTCKVTFWSKNGIRTKYTFHHKKTVLLGLLVSVLGSAATAHTLGQSLISIMTLIQDPIKIFAIQYYQEMMVLLSAGIYVTACLWTNRILYITVQNFGEYPLNNFDESFAYLVRTKSFP